MVKITTNKGKKLKVETEVKAIYQRLLYLIRIEIIKVDQKISRTRHH